MMSVHGQIVSTSRIVSMSGSLAPEQIAATLQIPVEDVFEHLAKAGRVGRGNWVLECLKTGRHWSCHTERSCYQKAQMIGLTDYTFGRRAVQ